MTILNALEQLYDRMAETGDAPRPGYSSERISFALVLEPEGRPPRLADKRSHVGEKPAAVSMNVPAGSRTSGIKPNLLWDKTAYVFGVVAVEEEDADGNRRVVPGQGKRTADEHAAFVKAHKELLSGTTDPGLVAVKRFLENWRPEKFAELRFDPDSLDQNVVFEFDDGDGLGFVHERPAALALFDVSADATSGSCLVTGEHAPIERLHPKIKGVMGAQRSGASLVSFNDDAYESFGKSQGGNAPVSKRAAFAYGAALNALLANGSERSFHLGDSTVVFWAEADQRETASSTELLMAKVFQPPGNASEALKLKAAIAEVASGRPTDRWLDPATRVRVLGLSPNAARLSVRFWHPGTFGEFARHVDRFWADLQIEPARWMGPPAAWSLLRETAVRVGGKLRAETIPRHLGGQLMRSLLTGRPLPRALLSAVIARIRADGQINTRRAAICRAVINRSTKEGGLPVSLDPGSSSQAYRLGRLLAAIERAQTKARPNLTANLRVRHFAAASATPARVFPLLIRNATRHAPVPKWGGGLRRSANRLEREIAAIWPGFGSDMPRYLSLEDQGRFVVGHYHQRWTKTKGDEAGYGTVMTEEKDR